jgi:hypothetical protein
MEFRLLYEGELLPSGNKKRRPAEKHAIRRAFHPQLRRLWNVKSNLRQYAGHMGNLASPAPDRSEQERFEVGINTIGKQWNRAGYDLVPLVIPDLGLQCILDILLLRPEEDRFIFEQGDIDGQVKTLLDALRIAQDPGETGGIGPMEDETPLFCLLENDRLISEVRVRADQLLMLPHQTKVRANDCFVVIHVKLNYKVRGTFGGWFE